MTEANVQQPTTTPTASDADVQTVALVSLGCPKNLVDSEKMLGLLAQDGLIPIDDETEADAIVVNTCGFLEASKDESLGVIREAAERKKAGQKQRLIVAGCLVQRHRAKMLEWCPEIDALIGVFDRDRITEAVRGMKREQTDLATDVPTYSSIAANDTVARRARGIEGNGYHESDAARLRLTPRHYAYLRISEGCNQNCAFCTIPSIRGKMRSKPLPSLLAETRELLADGAFELNMIGQDTTSFGEDIGYGAGLSGMLRELNDVAAENGGAWLRLMYAYPSCFTDEMIDTIAELPHVLKYIDMPLQHINDRVLDSMRRRTSRKLITTLLGKLRDRIPGMAIRTTFITGYPGETEAEHQELVAFVREFGFDNMGVFCYSPEPGTVAGRLFGEGDAVPEDVAEARKEELMLAQQEVVFARNAQLAAEGATFDVLIDDITEVEGEATAGVTEDEGRLYVGRTYQQAPDIDGQTYVYAAEELAVGELVRCTIIDSAEYDLIARPTAEMHRKVQLPIVE
ncbi:MAG: 30S ribosomal protein S12 methylthiotransferase RimO [Phycisphaeraceae bacterium]